ncbi:MAG: YybS family protein [Clostridiales bacterium]|nr:YybS family protein [Clostridiales bacterium]
MRVQTAKLTTAAVCTALAVIMCVFTAYLPFSFMPLYLAAFCIFLACKRGNIVYGILCALATVGVMFALVGLSASWFILLFMFAPYGILAYFMHRFTYFKVKSGIIRGVVMAAFFNLTMFFVYLVVTRVLTICDIPVDIWMERLGGYWVLAIIGTLVLVPLDFILSAMSAVILKRLPMPTGKRAAPAEKKDRAKEDKTNAEKDNANPLGLPDMPDDKKEQEKKYDIFGYEIIDKDEKDNS